MWTNIIAGLSHLTEMIEQLLVERLRRTGQYKSVQKISSTARGDYLLRGRLSAMNEVDDPAGIKARFSYPA